MPSTRRSDAPYISVVVGARNDDHGGNMLGRMQAFVDAWITQAGRYGLDSEIIVVEWNPPEQRPRLMDALKWPPDPGPCEVRFVNVAPDVHRRFANSETIPLHQMIAKNVGIRRARGEFVIAMNLDIVCSAELMQFLAERRLERGKIYRIDRHDVASSIPANGGADELLAFCNTHLLQVFTAEGLSGIAPDGLRALEKYDVAVPATGLRLGAGWYVVECQRGEHYRWLAPEAEIVYQKPPGTFRLALDVETGPSAGAEPVNVEIADASGRLLAAEAVRGRAKLSLYVPEHAASGVLRLRGNGAGIPISRDARMLNLRVFSLRWEHVAPSAWPYPDSASASAFQQQVGWYLETVPTGPPADWSATLVSASPSAHFMHNPAYLHTIASGDFTMLSRDDWFNLRGYPEFTTWPMHIDALFCYAAYHGGLQEVVLREPMRIFHIQHLAGAGWTPEGEQERTARVAAKGVSQMPFAELEKWIGLMRLYNAPFIFCPGNWGLGDVTLPETSVFEPRQSR